MIEDYFECPECGDILPSSISKDKEGKFSIEFVCEGDGDDRFSFFVDTGLTNQDIAKLVEGKSIKKEMIITCLERKSDPYKK